MTLPQTKKNHFDEPDWIKLVFLLNDTHNWLDQMSREALYQLPVNEKRKFRRKNYYLTVPALAHILEKHYFKINRHPNAAKFTLTAIDLLSYIRDAYDLPTSKVPGTTNFQRLVETDVQVGHVEMPVSTAFQRNKKLPFKKGVDTFLVTFWTNNWRI